MERYHKWLDVLLLVVKALAAALAALSADQVLTGGRLSDALHPLAGPLAVAQPLNDRQRLWLRSYSPVLYVPGTRWVSEKKSLRPHA